MPECMTVADEYAPLPAVTTHTEGSLDLPAPPVRRSGRLPRIILTTAGWALTGAATAAYLFDVHAVRTTLTVEAVIIVWAAITGLNLLYWAGEQGRYTSHPAWRRTLAILGRLAVIAPVNMVLTVGLVGIHLLVLVVTGGLAGILDGMNPAGLLGGDTSALVPDVGGVVDGAVTTGTGSLDGILPDDVTIPDSITLDDILGIAESLGIDRDTDLTDMAPAE